MKFTLLLLLALLPCILAIPHAQHVARTEAASAAAAASAPHAGVALLEQTAETDMAADQTNELMMSLRNLLQQRKQSENAARSKLEAAAQHTLQVEHALAEKQKQLQAHNAMLARLEQCLNQGPAEARFKQMEAKIHEQEQSLMEEHSTITTQEKQLHAAEAELASRKSELSKQRDELLSKQSELQKQQQELQQQTQLLAIKEKQMHEAEQKLAVESASSQQAIESAVQARLGKMRAELEAQHAAQLEAMKAVMQEQIKTVVHESQTALIQKKASRIASAHAFHALTSVEDDSPYAQAAAEAEAEEHEMEPEASVSLIESSATAHVAKNGTRASKLASRCSKHTSCATCSKDGRCGWCSAGKGQCLSLDVNANMRKGGVGDGLTSGQCTSDNWQTAVAARLTFLSLNVFASERANSTRRFAAIIQLIKKASPDVVALQEVEKWFVHALQAHSWVKNNYHFSEYGPGQAPGGLYILSRYPIAGTSYYEEIQPGQVEVSQRGRVLVAKLGVKQQAVYVANTALDYRSSEARAANLKFITTVLKPYAHVVLLGDFNFDEGSKLEQAALPKSYLDLWPILVPDKPGYTWDPRSNWFAAASDPLSRSSRIDRIFVKSNQWMPRAIHLVGCSVSDPLCGAKNLDVAKGVTIIDANKHNPAVILAAPTSKEDRKAAEAAAPEWGTKVFLESDVALSLESEEHAQIARALADSAEMDEEVALLETGAAPKPTFERNFVASNHFGLLAQITQFAPKCPIQE